MKRYTLFLPLLLLSFHFSARTQNDSIHAADLSSKGTHDSTVAKQVSPISKKERTPSTVPDKDYFKSVLTDSRDIIISPFRWNKYQWIAFSGITVLTGVFYTQDVIIHKVVEKNQTPSWNNASNYVLEPWGSGLYSLPALGLLYGVGAAIKNDRARYTSLKGVEAWVLAVIAENIVKQLANRNPPYQNNPANPYIWKGPFVLTFDGSFPSGHATNVFAVATVVATAYSSTTWVPVICYTIAGLAAASRVYQNYHWFSDVFAGSALGFAIGKTIINNHLKKLKLLPVSHVGTGVMLVYSLD